MRLYTILLLGLSLGLGGCTFVSTLKATTVSYRVPADAGETARLRKIDAQGQPLQSAYYCSPDARMSHSR